MPYRTYLVWPKRRNLKCNAMVLIFCDEFSNIKACVWMKGSNKYQFSWFYMKDILSERYYYYMLINFRCYSTFKDFNTRCSLCYKVSKIWYYEKLCMQDVTVRVSKTYMCLRTCMCLCPGISMYQKLNQRLENYVKTFETRCSLGYPISPFSLKSFSRGYWL